jgi:hypothetical protein
VTTGSSSVVKTVISWVVEAVKTEVLVLVVTVVAIDVLMSVSVVLAMTVVVKGVAYPKQVQPCEIAELA